MSAGRRTPVPWFAMPRPRLTGRVDAVSGGEVCAVVAPAGAGKSVLMSQWAAGHTDSAIAWIDLTRSSVDPVAFARQFVEAIAGVVPGFMETSRELFGEGGGLPGEAFVAKVLDELRGIDRPLDVVFDDVERIGALDPPAEIIDGLVERLPHTTRVFVIARWDPPLSFHRWRLDGRLHEVRATELAFDVDETALLIRDIAGIELDHDAARALHERTEGSVAGTQLAAISIANAPDPGRFIDGFAGTDAHVIDYLLHEVLSSLDPRVHQFLVHTSVLPWLSLELCSHVAETFDREEVASILDLLGARGLFLVPVDEHGSRLRHHQLVADVLRYELRRGDPSLEKRLRRRAADWLMAERYLSDAADELVELGDTEGLLALVREHGPRYYERNEAATLARWLVAVRESSPRPPVEVEIHLLAAQFACHQIAAAMDTSRALLRRTDLTRGERAVAEGLRALLGLHDLSPTETERAAANALEIVPTLEPGECFHVLGVGAESMIELFAWFMRGQAAFHDGDAERAMEMFERALASSESDYVAWRVYVLGAMALVQAWRGYLTDSETLTSTAVAVAQESLTPQYVGLAYALHAGALVALDRLDSSMALSYLEQSQPIVDRSLRPPLIGMQQLLRAGTTTVERGAAAALEAIERTTPPAIQPRVVDLARRSLHARLLIAVGRASSARHVVGSMAPSQHAPAIRVDVALALDDCRAARVEWTAWKVSESDLDALVGHRLRDAAITWREGSRPSALRALEEALSIAMTERLTRPFLEVPAALALLKSEPRLQNHPLAKELLAAAAVTYRREGRQDDLVEPLTERELEILALLPSRLENRDLASALTISVNTLKTHLRHIYTKLDVEDRDDAIDRAATIGLL